MNRSICLYAYYEKNNDYKENLKYFLKHGLNEYSDFIFILNGKCTVKIPEKMNISVYQRENKGYDFGAWSEVLPLINKDKYKYFIFMNTSVRGPYLKRKNKPWQNHLLELIKDNTKLVGTTINIFHMNNRLYPHVQSQVFAMDRECLDYLSDKIFISKTYKSFWQLIVMREIRMSYEVLANNWNINCLLPNYKDIDYRYVESDFNFSSRIGDPTCNGCYFGRTYDKYEVMFIKTNRDLILNFSYKIKHFVIALIIIILLLLIIWIKSSRK